MKPWIVILVYGLLLLLGLAGMGFVIYEITKLVVCISQIFV